MTKPVLSLEDRFMSHVQKSDDPDDCWEWIGAKYINGYGEFGIKNKTCLAHRVSYALFIGNIPDGMFVCHRCDNHSCVNPSHLFLGTHQDNIQDMMNKDRQNRGERHGMHKLTEQKVYQIREKLEQGYSHQQIANMFGVSRKTISHIKSKRDWKWLK